MIRGLLEAVGLFLLPFVAYALFLLVGRRYPGLRDGWSHGPLANLTVAGLGLVVASLLVAYVWVPRHHGAYAPAHIDRGRVVPGHFE